MAKNDNLRVDISATLNSRASKYAKFIPGFMVKWLEHTICQDELNGILERTSGKRGAEFCHAVLDDLDIKYNVIGGDNLPDNRRVVIVSNHPLGALDGITLIDLVSKIYGPGVKFIVNDLLMAVKPLDNVFLLIHKHGKQSRKSSSNIEEVFAGNDPIIIFPAGLVSRKRDEGIRDLKWQKMFINKAVQYHRDIIPVYFDGKNSPFFYNFAKLRTRVGLKFNIEMIYLQREILRSRHASFTIVAGKPIPYNRFKGGRNAAIEAKAMKRIVYDLKSKIQ